MIAANQTAEVHSDASSATVNIADRLTAVADRLGDKKAVVWPAGRDSAGKTRYEHITFTQLRRDVDRYAHGLERVGITRGTPTRFAIRTFTANRTAWKNYWTNLSWSIC